MKLKIPIIIITSLVIVVAAVLFINHRSNMVQIINDAAKMQRCDDAGMFTKLSGTKTKAWGFGSGGNMMFSGSVVCIYDGFGKPTISKITYEKKGEAEIYVQTNNSITNQNHVEVSIPKVFTIHVFDFETKSSFEIYPDAFQD